MRTIQPEVPNRTKASQSTELVNRYEFMPPFIREGFVPYVPEFDAGIDFALFREEDDLLLRVQLKSVWTVARKYFGRRIWIAFGDGYAASRGAWYLMPHDIMVEHGKLWHGRSASWGRGGYSSAGWGAERRAACAPFKVPDLLSSLTAETAADWLGQGATTWD